MPTLYEAEDGKNAVQYIHHSMVRFYLDQSYRFALDAQENDRKGLLQASTLISILFSAMTLEAFVNEMAEDVVKKESLREFIRLRGAFRMKKGESSVSAKVRILFEKKYEHQLSDETRSAIEDVIHLRNNMVHYKMSDMAGKRILPPMKETRLANGETMTTVDFMVEPVTVEPPFIQNLTAEAAISSFNTALAVLNKWGELAGEPDNVPGLEAIV